MKSPVIMLCNRHIKRQTNVMAKVRGGALQGAVRAAVSGRENV